jgi:nucleoside 2-deoxyribosyltransferase
MSISCLFCNNDVTNDGGHDFGPSQTLYMCHRCGFIHLTSEAVEDFDWGQFKEKDRKAISIILRNEWERRGRKRTGKKITFSDLEQIVSLFRPLDPIEKMDHALINFEKTSLYVGSKVKINADHDYPLYYCDEPGELIAICNLLFKEGLIHAPDPLNPHNNLTITAKGYQRLREIKKPNRSSRQCFVAMWFTPEMNEVYESAIKQAIEFVEEGESLPRFEAVKIDNVEHVNDINDEIIGQIRRSRFMVCDLTGYRGGVYFEAGFAYGLGLDVIYTCRKWTKEEILKNKEGQEVISLYDNNSNEIQIKKEGVHFDLANRNRIEWSPDNLEDFKVRLENRIKAVIY